MFHFVLYVTDEMPSSQRLTDQTRPSNRGRPIHIGIWVTHKDAPPHIKWIRHIDTESQDRYREKDFQGSTKHGTTSVPVELQISALFITNKQRTVEPVGS